MVLSRNKRKEVYMKADGRCERCGRPLYLDEMTIDHIRPQCMFKKGEAKNSMDNLACLCKICNATKANMSTKEFRQFVHIRKVEFDKLNANMRKLERQLRGLTQKYNSDVKKIKTQENILRKEINSSRFNYIRYLHEQCKNSSRA